MAHSFASIPTSETDLLALDKPIVSGYPTVADDIEWRSVVDFTGGSSQSDAAFPEIRAVDSKTNLPTQPSATTPGIILFDFTENPIEFDFISIINHNLGDLVAGTEIATFFVADDNAFSVNLRTGLGFGPSYTAGDNDRIISLDLRHGGSPSVPQRYSNVQFCALEFVGIDGSAEPFIGEIIWGRRRQLQQKANVPWDPDGVRSDVEDFVSQSGVISRYTRTKGKRVISANVNPFEDPFRQDIIDVVEAAQFGTKPFIWIEDPSSSERKFHLMLQDDPGLDFPLEGPFERQWQFVATEQGPKYLTAEF